MSGARVAVRAGAALAALAGAFVAFTWWALEASGVAVLETKGPDGVRSTHVWFAEDAGELLVEAGTPENGWYVDALATPELAFRPLDGAADGTARAGRYAARPLPNPEGHARIRRLLRAKYGLRDRWIALLFETERSVAVRLEPLPAAR